MAQGRFKDFFGGAIANAIAPFIQQIAKGYFKMGWDELKRANPEAHKTTLTSLYPTVDVHLETLSEKTKTLIDDALTGALLESIEDSARESGFELPNLDSD